MALPQILGALAGGGIKDVLTGVGEFAKDIREAITGEIPPEKKAEIQQRALEIEFASTKAQTDINVEEAKNPNVFVSGWRPFVGWVCGFSLGYNFILQPLITWGLRMVKPEIQPPTLDMSSLITILLAILGLGVYRTYEKVQDAAGNH